MIRACLNDWKQCVYGDKKFLDSKHGMIIETSEREEERRSERVTGEGSAWTLRVHVPSLRRSVATIRVLFNMAHTYVLGPRYRGIGRARGTPVDPLNNWDPYGLQFCL